MPPEQVREILEKLAQLTLFVESGQEKAESRMKRLEEKVLNEFTRDGGGNSGAFADPDFQSVVKRAQIEFARSGDDELADTLVQIISKRSQCETRGRLALSLNEAITVAPLLTKEDLALLGLTFFVGWTKRLGLAHRTQLVEHFAVAFELLQSIHEVDASAAFIESRACATLTPLFSLIPSQHVIQNYPGLFSAGFTKEQLGAVVALPAKAFIFQCMEDDTKLQFIAQDLDMLSTLSKQAGAADEDIEKYKNLFNGSLLPSDQARQKLFELDPRFKALDELFEKTSARALRLTTLGVAIGHAVISQRSKGDNGQLSIWIK